MKHAIAAAANALRAGELVAFPTETVYGLGADARNDAALAKIFHAKGRPADHPLIVHLPAVSHLEQWARDIPAAAWALANAFWPGPLTLILPRAVGVSDLVTGGQDSVGLRVPDHPVAQALLATFGSGIAAPSANRFGRISPTSAAHVREELGDDLLVLDGGPCRVGIESTIVDLTHGSARILRPGHISAEAIARVIGASHAATAPGDNPVVASASAHDVTGPPRVSGSLDAHYAPRTPLRLLAWPQLREALNAAHARAQRVAVLARRAPPDDAPACLWRQAERSAEGFARTLYADLRELDAAQCALILVEAPEASPSWAAVADRLRRAAAGSGTH